MYEPYKTESLHALMKKIYNLGFYRQVPEVMKITIRNAFEGFSGRASETWETQFEVELVDIFSDNGTQIFYAGIFKARTLDEACEKALKAQTPTPTK